jgi:hypothetical protein
LPKGFVKNSIDKKKDWKGGKNGRMEDWKGRPNLPFFLIASEDKL